MDKEKREIRFLISRVIYDELKKDAKELDIPLASYIKSFISSWTKNIKIIRFPKKVIEYKTKEYFICKYCGLKSSKEEKIKSHICNIEEEYLNNFKLELVDIFKIKLKEIKNKFPKENINYENCLFIIDELNTLLNKNWRKNGNRR